MAALIYKTYMHLLYSRTEIFSKNKSEDQKMSTAHLFADYLPSFRQNVNVWFCNCKWSHSFILVLRAWQYRSRGWM